MKSEGKRDSEGRVDCYCSPLVVPLLRAAALWLLHKAGAGHFIRSGRSSGCVDTSVKISDELMKLQLQ